MIIENIETGFDDYVCKSSPNLSIYRFARVINSEVNHSIVGDYAHVKDSWLGEKTLINRNAFILRSRIGKKSQIGFNTKIMYADIGKFCSISWDCSVGGPNHNMKACTTFNFTGERTHYTQSGCTVNNDVWIGSGATILRNTTIGHGAVIGGGSVVTHDVADYEIVAGVPARHLGWRFDEETRSKLRNSEWWNLPIEIIEANLELFSADINVEVLDKILKLASDYGIIKR